MAYAQDIHFAVACEIGGDGTAGNPYTGPANNDTWLDAILSDSAKVGPNQTLRFGPGTFQTRGNDVNGAGWSARSGMRIIGSGINVTTLKLYNFKSGHHSEQHRESDDEYNHQ